MRYMTCSRNFNEKISQKQSFTSLLTELKNQIISFLFNTNHSNFLTTSAPNINTLNLIDQINSYYTHKHNEQPSQTSTPSSYSNRKQSTDTVNNQEDSTLLCEDDIKTKINITPLTEENILLFLTKIIPLLDIPLPIMQHLTTQSLITYIISTSSLTPPSHTTHPHLRKHICMKLYKTLSFMFKLSSTPDSTIKQLCISIESLLRNKDIEMSTQYRMRMHSIFKAINN